MNCVTHPELPAIAYCRTCGRALCEQCERTANGIIYCAEHVPVAAPAGATPNPAATGAPVPPTDPAYSPYTSPAPPPAANSMSGSPGLAFVLGFIPGVGAIYNGQYLKGLIHVVILGFLIGILDHGDLGGMEPLVALTMAAFFFYMAFEAYHTAKKRQLGQYVDEFSSIVPLRTGSSRFPVGPIVMIALGVVFLLNTLGLLRFDELIRFWPVALIALGAYMLYERLTGATPAAREISHERQ